MKVILNENDILNPAFYNIMCGAKVIIQHKLYQLKDRKWTFKGMLSYPNFHDFKFEMEYEDEETEENYFIAGICHINDKFNIKEAYFDFNIWNEKKNVGFKINIDEEAHLKQIEEVINIVLNNNNSYRYFCEDYMRYTKRNPIDHVKTLLTNNLITMEENIYDDGPLGITSVYSGEYGEEYFEIVIDDSEIDEEEEFYPMDMITVSIGGRFYFNYSAMFSEEIRALIPLLKNIHIPADDFLVRTNTLNCIYKEHQLNRIKALVFVDDGKKLKEVQINAVYCVGCKKYFISEVEFEKLCEEGRVCCRVITIAEYKKIQESGYYSWAEQSLLRSYGYNVNAQENLTDYERKRILSFVIENEIMQPVEIIQFLEWLISRNSSKNFQLARSKWNRDIDYIRNYQPVAGIVKVKNIYRSNVCI